MGASFLCRTWCKADTELLWFYFFGAAYVHWNLLFSAAKIAELPRNFLDIFELKWI
jgi:hypothetical protein